jgi:hypothetical protein
MNWNVCGRKRSWPISMCCPGNRLETDEKFEYPQDSCCPNRDSKRKPLECRPKLYLLEITCLAHASLMENGNHIRNGNKRRSYSEASVSVLLRTRYLCPVKKTKD